MLGTPRVLQAASCPWRQDGQRPMGHVAALLRGRERLHRVAAVQQHHRARPRRGDSHAVPGRRPRPRPRRLPRRGGCAEGGFTARGRRRRPRGDNQLRAVRQHNQSGARVRRRASHGSHRRGASRPRQPAPTDAGEQDRRSCVRVEACRRWRGLAARGNSRDQRDGLLDARERPRPRHVHACVEINQCVGCTRQFFTKSFLGDDAAVLARSSGEEPASPRHRAGVASMASRTTR